MFNGEYSSLKIRLDELYSIVDLFIICESKYTHSGIKKEKLFTDNCKILDQYKNKILIVIDHKKHFTCYAPIREMLQRKLISKELKKIRLKKSDLIIHSDCDEIPRKNIIESLVKKKEECNVLLQMNNYVNYLNIYAGSWVRARVVSFAHYRTIQNMRKDIFLYQAFNKRRHRLPFIRVPNYFTARRFFLWKIPEIIYQKQCRLALQ
jgi:hypothetical protein